VKTQLQLINIIIIIINNNNNNIDTLVLGIIPYRAVNTFHCGYENQAVNDVRERYNK